MATIGNKLHVVVAPVGTLGDLLPAAAIAHALAARGHHVEMVVHEYFLPFVPDGVATIAYGDAAQYARDLADKRMLDLAHPMITEVLVAPSVLPQFRAVEAAVAKHGRRNVVVLGPGSSVGAMWGARCCGALSIGLISAPPVFAIYQMPRPVSDGVVRAAFRAAGISPLPPPVYDPERRFSGDFSLEFDYWLEMYPAWFAPSGAPRADNLLTGTFPLKSSSHIVEEAQRFAADGPAPWVFFPGTGGALRKACPDFNDLVREACERSGRRGIVLDRTQPEAFRRYSDLVAGVRFTNLDALLPLSRGLLHHGGVGASSQGLVYGIPQVVVPVSFDQPGNAAWLEAAGVAVTCAPPELNCERLQSMLTAAEALPPAPLQRYAELLRSEGGAAGLAEKVEAVALRRALEAVPA